jgi:hypothetical protein
MIELVWSDKSVEKNKTKKLFHGLDFVIVPLNNTFFHVYPAGLFPNKI